MSSIKHITSIFNFQNAKQYTLKNTTSIVVMVAAAVLLVLALYQISPTSAAFIGISTASGLLFCSSLVSLLVNQSGSSFKVSKISPPPLLPVSESRVLPNEPEVSVVKDYQQHIGDWSDLGNEEIPFNEDLLCRYLSEIPCNFRDKRFLVLSLDRGGFGDFVFGLKTLDILQRQFPGVQAALATDSPTRAACVNTSRNRLILKPHNAHDKMALKDVVTEIENFQPDFMIVAPVTHFNQTPLSNLLQRVPHLFIREYGFTERNAPISGEEYISGAGEDFKGCIIHSSLKSWAESEDVNDSLKRLSYLQYVQDSRIIYALLGAPYCEEKVRQFDREYELFLGYSQFSSAKLEFIISIAKMSYVHLKSNKNLCFFFMGQPQDELLQMLLDHEQELMRLGIGRIRFLDPIQGGKEVAFQGNNSRILKIVSAPLPPNDVIHMLKASEKEILSTGDQFWSEAISAHKHWIQENLLHKRDALKNVIGLAQTIPSYLQGRQDFYRLLADALRPVGLFSKKPLERCEAQALLLYQARTNQNIEADWHAMNALITTEHVLEPWITGMIIKKFLEQNPGIKTLFDQMLQDKKAPANEIVKLLIACYDAFNN